MNTGIKKNSNGYLYNHYGFVISKMDGSYVAYNTQKPFEEGHTHLGSFSSAKDAIKFCMRQVVPWKANYYYLESLQRLTNSKTYYNKLEERKQEIKEHGRFYCG